MDVDQHCWKAGFVHELTVGDDAGWAPQNYGPNYERLRQVGVAYDPDNVLTSTPTSRPRAENLFR